MYQFPHLGAYSPPLRTADYKGKEWMVAEKGKGWERRKSDRARTCNYVLLLNNFHSISKVHTCLHLMQFSGKWIGSN